METTEVCGLRVCGSQLAGIMLPASQSGRRLFSHWDLVSAAAVGAATAWRQFPCPLTHISLLVPACRVNPCVVVRRR